MTSSAVWVACGGGCSANISPEGPFSTFFCTSVWVERRPSLLSLGECIRRAFEFRKIYLFFGI